MELDNAQNFKVSPDGKFLAFTGRYGRIHLFSAKVSGLKQNNVWTSIDPFAMTGLANGFQDGILNSEAFNLNRLTV